MIFSRKCLIITSSGRPISRILSSMGFRFTPYVLRRSSGQGLPPGLHAWAIISLGSLPGTANEAGSLSSLLGLAPGGGCLAACITADAGGLLHHLFTVTSPPTPLPQAGERTEERRFVSVALFRQVSPPRGFPGAVPCGVRTFLGSSHTLGTATARSA